MAIINIITFLFFFILSPFLFLSIISFLINPKKYIENFIILINLFKSPDIFLKLNSSLPFKNDEIYVFIKQFGNGVIVYKTMIPICIIYFRYEFIGDFKNVKSSSRDKSSISTRYCPVQVFLLAKAEKIILKRIGKSKLGYDEIQIVNSDSELELTLNSKLKPMFRSFLISKTLK
jgi:hypothetical protein